MLLDATIVSLFVGFALIAGLLWPKMLNDHITNEAKELQETFPRIRHADFAKILQEETAIHRYRDYIVPTGMFAVIVAIGSILIVSDTDASPDLMRYDVLFGAATGEAALKQMQHSILMIQCSFLGAFMWSLQYLLRRAQARDIGPTTIYRICLYMLFGMVLAVFVNHFSQDGAFGLDDVTILTQTLPVLGFMTGYFSIEVFEMVTNRFFRRRSAEKKDVMPPALTVIEGISYDTSVRLRELWLDDAYAIACTNPIEIYLKTPFPLEQCIDWMAQAQLLVRTKVPVFEFLRNVGIRTVLDLYALVKERDPATGHNAFDRLLDAHPFAADQDEVRKTLRTLSLHAALTLEADLTFRRLRQLSLLLGPTAAEDEIPPAANDAAPPPADAAGAELPAAE